MVFSQINLKAATITGAVLGFLFGIFMVPYGMTGYGMFGMMGYMMGYVYPTFSLLSLIIPIICGAIAGAVIAIVYNWAIKLK